MSSPTAPSASRSSIEDDVQRLLQGPRRVALSDLQALATFRGFSLGDLERLPGFPGAYALSARSTTWDRRSIIRWLQRRAHIFLAGAS